MAETRYLSVICYDIELDRRRRKVASRLEEMAVRVQLSVFEAWLTERELDRLIGEIESMIGQDDSVRAYQIAPDGLRRCRTLGPTPAPSGDAYHLV
jgi:CRISPR-associated protein Cas2